MTPTLLNTIRRVVMAVLGLALLVLGVLTVAHAMGLTAPMALTRPGFRLGLDLSEEPFLAVLPWIGVGLGVTLLGGLLAGLGLWQISEDTRQVVLSGASSNGRFGGGEVTVTLQSVRALAAFAAERVEGVREALPRLRLRRDGWYIDCRVVLTPDAILPEVTSTLKQVITERIAHHTGLPVARINISAQLDALDARWRLQ